MQVFVNMDRPVFKCESWDARARCCTTIRRNLRFGCLYSFRLINFSMNLSTSGTGILIIITEYCYVGERRDRCTAINGNAHCLHATNNASNDARCGTRFLF